jgi:cytochrome c oxidase subunit II
LRRPGRSRRAGRLLALAVPAALAGLLVAAVPALGDALTPESGGSPNADEIDSLYKLVGIVAIVVFVVVEGLLIYSLVRFRAKKGAVAAQIRGNTNLEIGWTVAAALILVFLTVFTFAKLNGINDPPRASSSSYRASAGGTLFASVDQPNPPGGKKLNIEVNGQQYVWRYTYPNGAFSYDTMVVPVETTVTLDVEAQDVIHSWWIPKLGGKVDATPGYKNQTWFRIPSRAIPPGRTSVTFKGQCAELCGPGHAEMLARVKAVPVSEFRNWLAQQKREIDQANRQAAQDRRRFNPIPPE